MKTTLKNVFLFLTNFYKIHILLLGMSQKITIYLKGIDEPLTAIDAFVDGELRLIEIKKQNGAKRKIPFESILYFDVEQS